MVGGSDPCGLLQSRDPPDAVKYAKQNAPEDRGVGLEDPSRRSGYWIRNELTARFIRGP